MPLGVNSDPTGIRLAVVGKRRQVWWLYRPSLVVRCLATQKIR
jgi:hypothetical protein